MASTNRMVTKIKLKATSNISFVSLDSVTKYGMKLMVASSVPNNSQRSRIRCAMFFEFPPMTIHPLRAEYKRSAKEAAVQKIVDCAYTQTYKDIKDELLYVRNIICQIGTTTPLIEGSETRRAKLKRLRKISLKLKEFKQNFRTRSNSESTQGSSSGTNSDVDSNSHPDPELNLCVDVECDITGYGTMNLRIEEVPDEEERLNNLKFELSPDEEEVCYLMMPRFIVDSVSLCELINKVNNYRSMFSHARHMRVIARFCAWPQTDQQWIEKQKVLKRCDVTDIFLEGDKWKQFIRTVEHAENNSVCWDICLIRSVAIIYDNDTDIQVSLPTEIANVLEQPIDLTNLKLASIPQHNPLVNNEISENVLSPDSGNVMNATDDTSFQSHSESANQPLTNYNNNNNQFTSEDNSDRDCAADIQTFVQTANNSIIQDSINDLMDILTNPGHHLSNSPTSIYMRALGQMDMIDKLRRQFLNVHHSNGHQTFHSNSNYPYNLSNRPQRTTVHLSLPTNSSQQGHSSPYQSTTANSSLPSFSCIYQPNNPAHADLSYTNRQTTVYSGLPDSLYPIQPITVYSNEPIGVHNSYYCAHEHRQTRRRANIVANEEQMEDQCNQVEQSVPVDLFTLDHALSQNVLSQNALSHIQEVHLRAIRQFYNRDINNSRQRIEEPIVPELDSPGGQVDLSPN